MKQTILSKCFSKMKRVALTLFAALCVGSVWAEEGEVITPEVTPEPDPAPSASALSIDPSAGYVLTGLGELGDQAAVVFTNSAEAANWQVPRTLKNVEILAVGGGGGGGGHFKGSESKYHQGGAGGGGGAVVTGFIKELAADQVVNVTVGAGGAGGAATTSATTGAGAGGNGGNSVLKVGDVTYVTAYGGGGDGGYNSAGVANGGSNSGTVSVRRTLLPPAYLQFTRILQKMSPRLTSQSVSLMTLQVFHLKKRLAPTQQLQVQFLASSGVLAVTVLLVLTSLQSKSSVTIPTNISRHTSSMTLKRQAVLPSRISVSVTT